MSSTTCIGAEAFANIEAIVGVDLPDCLSEIHERAFANCVQLEMIRIPDSVTSIAEDAFVGCDSLRIYCNAGSVAAKFASAHSIQMETLSR